MRRASTAGEIPMHMDVQVSRRPWMAESDPPPPPYKQTTLAVVFLFAECGLNHQLIDPGHNVVGNILR